MKKIYLLPIALNIFNTHAEINEVLKSRSTEKLSEQRNLEVHLLNSEYDFNSLHTDTYIKDAKKLNSDKRLNDVIVCIAAMSPMRTEHPEIFDRLENLKKLILNNECPGCDLIGMNLSSLDLSNANLSGANMTGANVSDSDLSQANLRNAKFSYANLNGVNFDHADLSHADISNSRIKNVKGLHSVKSIVKRLEMILHDGFHRYVKGD